MVSNIDYTGDGVAKKQAVTPHQCAAQYGSLPQRRPVCQSPPMRSPNYYAAPGFERAGLRRREPEWIRDRVLGSLNADDVEERLIRGEFVFLGLIDERAHFALDVSASEAPLDMLRSPALAAAGIAEGGMAQIGVRFADLRQLAGRLDRHEGALLALARAMMFWHSRHRFCGLCGTPTRSE